MPSNPPMMHRCPRTTGPRQPVLDSRDSCEYSQKLAAINAQVSELFNSYFNFFINKRKKSKVIYFFF